MPIREFIDAEGVRWQVWSTVPFTTGVAGNLRRGWLTFETSGARRRLAPIPPGWEDASVLEMRDYCQRAEPAGRTPITGTWRVEKREP